MKLRNRNTLRKKLSYMKEAIIFKNDISAFRYVKSKDTKMIDEVWKMVEKHKGNYNTLVNNIKRVYLGDVDTNTAKTIRVNSYIFDNIMRFEVFNNQNQTPSIKIKKVLK